MSTILYGIPNCDTIKKAKKWLADNDIAFTFHDYRKDGIDNDFLVRAESELGWGKQCSTNAARPFAS